MAKSLLLAVTTFAFCSVAFAQAPMPGSSLGAPGSGSVGAPEATAPTNQLWTDKNGDGIIQRDEVTPGSQLANRFDTRDANHDGQLTSDEYYLPK